MKKVRIAVLVSGGGTNLQALTLWSGQRRLAILKKDMVMAFTGMRLFHH